jgi:hypothetical protein
VSPACRRAVSSRFVEAFVSVGAEKRPSGVDYRRKMGNVRLVS